MTKQKSEKYPTPIEMETPSPYRDWAIATTDKTAFRSPALEPVLIRLKGDNDEDRTATRRSLITALEKGSLFAEAHDRALLTDRAETAGKRDGPLDEDVYQVYQTFGNDLDRLRKFATIMDVGLPLPVSGTGKIFDPIPSITADIKPTTPIVAVIDDGIGFLNRRFRTARGDSRVHAIWLQSLNTIFDTVLGGFYTFSGQVLFKPEIDTILARGVRLDESAVYRSLNVQNVKAGEHRSSEFSFSHGTHTMDIAAGAEPNTGSPTEDWPILAVQLPPEVVNNTSGTQLEPSLIQGVKWILAQAARINDTSPVIINISFGTFAGPKDGTKFVEFLIAQELARWQTQTGRCARVVYAFGNDRESGQLARLKIDSDGDTTDLEWRVQPDNAASSLMEIHLDAGSSSFGNIAISLTAPSGTQINDILIPPFQTVVLQNASGDVLAQIFHIGAIPIALGKAKPAFVMIAIPPTQDGAFVRSEHGSWQIGLRNNATSAIVARLEIQRGDTPIGYKSHGRQSSFYHLTAHEWSTETFDYSALATDCPITTDGTHSSFVTAVTRHTISVAASVSPSLKAASYSGEGSDFTIPGPSISAIGEDAPGGRGVLAAGTFSGSVQSSNGTSAAAARVTHAMALHFAKVGCQTDTSTSMDVELAKLLGDFGTIPAVNQIRRLGAGIVTHPASCRYPR